MSYQPAIPYEHKTWRHFTVSTQQNGAGITATGFASQAWPLANLALYIPTYFSEAATIYQVGVGCGATAGGNFDIGLYDMAGTLLQSTGTTGRTASAWNAVNWADLDVQPGWYYAAMSADGTNNYSGTVPAAGLNESLGICEQTSAFVLPSTATLTRTTRTLLPNITFTMRSISI